MGEIGFHRIDPSSYPLKVVPLIGSASLAGRFVIETGRLSGDQNLSRISAPSTLIFEYLSQHCSIFG